MFFVLILNSVWRRRHKIHEQLSTGQQYYIGFMHKVQYLGEDQHSNWSSHSACAASTGTTVHVCDNIHIMKPLYQKKNNRTAGTACENVVRCLS